MYISNTSSSKFLICQKVKRFLKKTLRESGYKNVNFIYTDKKDIKQKRSHSRYIIWFNPSFNNNVSTNVTKRFWNLIDQHFPESNKLRAVKVSYSCTQNTSSTEESRVEN